VATSDCLALCNLERLWVADMEDFDFDSQVDREFVEWSLYESVLKDYEKLELDHDDFE